MATVVAGRSAEWLKVRQATAMEVFNIPLYEVPPMLDVRSSHHFKLCHAVCAVSAPVEDGMDEGQLLERIRDHDENYGWMLQHPFVIVHDEASSARAAWLVEVLRRAVADRREAQVVEGADPSEYLLRRLASQCRQILLLRHAEFEMAFPFCCANGAGDFAAVSFFDSLGPLPRCVLLQPRIYVAGRQVSLTTTLLAQLSATHVVVNASSEDMADGTSGGGGGWLADRPADSPNVLYLKCDVADSDDAAHVPSILSGAAAFLEDGSAKGGAGLVRLHGQSRSASVFLAFLIQTKKLSVQHAWSTLQECGMAVDERLIWWDALQSLLSPAKALGDSMT